MYQNKCYICHVDIESTKPFKPYTFKNGKEKKYICAECSVDFSIITPKRYIFFTRFI